jgi:hypothetical protein
VVRPTVPSTETGGVIADVIVCHHDGAAEGGGRVGSLRPFEVFLREALEDGAIGHLAGGTEESFVVFDVTLDSRLDQWSVEAEAKDVSSCTID